MHNDYALREIGPEGFFGASVPTACAVPSVVDAEASQIRLNSLKLKHGKTILLLSGCHKAAILTINFVHH